MSRMAIVTGTSKGIGRAIASQLVAKGLDVLATSRDPVRGAATAKELGLPFHPLDVASEASVRAFAADVDGVDVLVNNAGIALDGFDADVVRKTLEVNLHGAMRVTEALLPKMRPGARIVMVSSGMGELSCISGSLREVIASPSLSREEMLAIADRFVREVAAGTHTKSGFPSSGYRVSKVLLNAYTRILARELACDSRKILVNAACPGWVRTDMGGRGAPRSPEEGARTPVWLATLPDGGPSGGFFRDEQAIAW
jgi:NAD(P)-dependent dehydrogenase (short-subunit alcohol dehydrogenase family)